MLFKSIFIDGFSNVSEFEYGSTQQNISQIKSAKNFLYSRKVSWSGEALADQPFHKFLVHKTSKDKFSKPLISRLFVILIHIFDCVTNFNLPTKNLKKN